MTAPTMEDSENPNTNAMVAAVCLKDALPASALQRTQTDRQEQDPNMTVDPKIELKRARARVASKKYRARRKALKQQKQAVETELLAVVRKLEAKVESLQAALHAKDGSSTPMDTGTDAGLQQCCPVDVMYQDGAPGQPHRNHVVSVGPSVCSSGPSVCSTHSSDPPPQTTNPDSSCQPANPVILPAGLNGYAGAAQRSARGTPDVLAVAAQKFLAAQHLVHPLLALPGINIQQLAAFRTRLAQVTGGGTQLPAAAPTPVDVRPVQSAFQQGNVQALPSPCQPSIAAPTDQGSSHLPPLAPDAPVPVEAAMAGASEEQRTDEEACAPCQAQASTKQEATDLLQHLQRMCSAGPKAPSTGYHIPELLPAPSLQDMLKALPSGNMDMVAAVEGMLPKAPQENQSGAAAGGVAALPASWMSLQQSGLATLWTDPLVAMPSFDTYCGYR